MKTENGDVLNHLKSYLSSVDSSDPYRSCSLCSPRPLATEGNGTHKEAASTLGGAALYGGSQSPPDVQFAYCCSMKSTANS